MDLTTAPAAGPGTGARNRVVDLVRVTALCGVVVGHWLKQGWYVDDAGSLQRTDLLTVAPWTHLLTWVLQVMPLFFLVGGYVNALSWRHARSRDAGYGTWLAGRVTRLTRPLLPLLGFWCAAALVAPFLGLDDGWLRIASSSSLTLTWFVAVYVVVVALVPMTLAAWDRWGPWTLAVGLVALPVDTASMLLGSSPVGALNLLLVWGTLHQLGYAWLDGAVGRRRSLLLAGGGLLCTAALVALGPYAVSMVGSQGPGVSNTQPPRATLLFLGTAMVGLVLAAEPVLQRLTRYAGVWRAVVVVEARVMTLYLWHPTALALLGAAALLLGGFGLHDRPDTTTWWAARPAWFAALLVTTIAIVSLVGRFEDPVPGTRECSPGLPLVAVVVTATSVGAVAAVGLGTGNGNGWLVGALSLVALTTVDALLRAPTARAPSSLPGPRGS
ncbi:acyltransferase family protein [Nocardioides euryhalodurans]|uniref:Acyltransferase n=1 Tax=Nocardioides euryhalodurans TaxID=2518370 RepID=A0A4P7GHU6_9ACTN|nr:acyltransferase family protein [Nocardioides euryhalodurans]QBR91257.1 acyltransferase [Nocardioides euryhalodurans]